MESQKLLHLYWLIALVVVVFIVRFYYVGLIDSQELRHAQENKSAVVTAELARGFDDQSFDGRSYEGSGMSDNNKVWELLDDREFLIDNVFYDFNKQTLKLNSGKIWKDVVSGLVWSGPSDLPVSNEFVLNDDGGVSQGGAFGFCEALNKLNYGERRNWELPTQKQLMQAYINGAGGVLVDRTNYFWSATEFFGDLERAWRVNLMSGDVTSSPKSNESSNYVICVSK